MESNQQLLVGVLAGVGIALGATFLLGHRQQYAPPFNHHNPRSSSTDPSDRRQANLLELGDDDSAIRNGFSMREAKDHSSKKAQLSAQRTPEEVLHALQRGNTRFWMGVATRPEVSAFERRALIMRQHPSVAILGCADSRVPIEIVFDQGLGDVFTIRVAGNCMDTATEGTLEYAVCDTSSALSLSLLLYMLVLLLGLLWLPTTFHNMTLTLLLLGLLWLPTTFHNMHVWSTLGVVLILVYFLFLCLF